MTPRAVLAAVLAMLAAPGVAGAAPTPGDYGGGGYTPGHQPTWMWGRVAPDGSATIGGRAVLSCITGWFDGTVRLAPDGSFSFTRRHAFREAGHRLSSTITVRGRFDGTVATGTLQARGRDRLPDGRVQRCRTRGARPWKMHLRPAVGPPGPPLGHATYLGLTSQAAGTPRPFVLHLNRRASHVYEAVFDYVRRCRRRDLTLNNVTPGAPIRPDGTFVLRDDFTLRYHGGGRERFRVRVRGRFTAGGVAGSLRVTSVMRRGERVVDRCDTGPLAFAALV